MTPIDSCYIKLIILRDQILFVIVSQPLINSNLLSYMHAETGECLFTTSQYLLLKFEDVCIIFKNQVEKFFKQLLG